MNPFVMSALIGGGSTVLGNIIGGNNTKQITARGRKQALEFFNRGRKHELQDRDYARHRYNVERGHMFDNARTLGRIGRVDHRKRAGIDLNFYKRAGRFDQKLTAQQDERRWQMERYAKTADMHNMREQFGLTPQEIMGSPIGGGVSGGASGATMGSAPAAREAGAAAIQARAASENAAADRSAMLQAEAMRSATQLRTAEIAAGASRGATLGAAGRSVGETLQRETASKREAETRARGQLTDLERTRIAAKATEYAASVSAEASKYASNVARSNAIDQIAENHRVNTGTLSKIAAETAAVMQDTRFAKVLHDERWARMWSTIGPENMTTAMVAAAYGIDPQKVLAGKVSEEDMVKIDNAVRRIQSLRSKVSTEVQGVAEEIRLNVDAIFDGLFGE